MKLNNKLYRVAVGASIIHVLFCTLLFVAYACGPNFVPKTTLIERITGGYVFFYISLSVCAPIIALNALAVSVVMSLFDRWSIQAVICILLSIVVSVSTTMLVLGSVSHVSDSLVYYIVAFAYLGSSGAISAASSCANFMHCCLGSLVCLFL